VLNVLQYKDARWLTNIQTDREFQALSESILLFRKNIFVGTMNSKRKRQSNKSFIFLLLVN
jgi:hypothetical protein